MPNLLSLPEELLCKTSGFVHPQTVIDWACTCAVLSRCSLQALTTHKQCRSELRVVHDRNPITIPSLSRRSLSEPEILWYLRSLGIWDLREKFEEWKSPSFTRSGGNPVEDWDSEEFLNWPEKHHDYSHLDTTFYADEELERYRSMLSKSLHLSEPLVDKWMERLRSGSDEPQKLLLMAMSPRLNKVTFVEYDSWQSGERSHPFRMLASTLRALAPLPSPQWPFFQNLKTVFVGESSDLRHPHDGYYPHSRVIAPLFLLPAIEELHLNLLMGEQNDPESDLENDGEDGEHSGPYVWEWETGRSSCQELTFYCCELATETIASFISATHSLRSLHGVTNEDEIMSALLEHSKHSLETLNFDGDLLPTSGAVPQHSLQKFQRLANIVVSTSQLIEMSTYKSSQIKYTVDGGIDKEKSAFGITDWVDLLAFLPPTLQTLKIVPSHAMDLFGHEVESLTHRLVALVNAKLSQPNGAFASLTAICLVNLSVKSGRWAGHEWDALDPWLGDLKRVSEEAKVNIHIDGKIPSVGGPFGDCLPCSSWRTIEIRGIDSAPVIPEEED